MRPTRGEQGTVGGGSEAYKGGAGDGWRGGSEAYKGE